LRSDRVIEITTGRNKCASERSGGVAGLAPVPRQRLP